RNPRYAYNIGHYAAGRSLQGELDQQRRYGPLLSEAKTLGRSQLDVLGPKMGLRWEHIHRAKAQIDRVAFGAADLLFKGGTGGTILGDYHSGTLRVEMNEEVDAAILGKAMTAHHEVAHAGSAQSHPDARSGLSVGNRGNHMGLNANEAIATFVSEEAYGLPHITRLGDDSIQVSVNGIYTAPTVAAASLYFRQPGDFAALYRAHYGQVDDQRHLAHVLTGFDTEVHRINQYLAPRR
ncbi:MAG TPA: hypothetical protein VD735_07195, partial [Candidatus Saccharimonadales bacterium]|nr:hypothetical protein [Candidatus Saccharimonadales bacterium]